MYSINTPLYFGDKIVIKPFIMGTAINKLTTSEPFLLYIYNSMSKVGLVRRTKQIS